MPARSPVCMRRGTCHRSGRLTRRPNASAGWWRGATRSCGIARGAQMLPVLGREVVEGEQRVAILDQTLDRLVVFDAPGLDEGVEGRKRILLGFCHPDFLQRPLGFQLLALRQFVEDVGGFMHPAALAARLGPYLFERLPESKRAISDGELGANREPAPLQIEKQFPPRLRTLAHTVGEADKLLPALGCGSDDDQQALRAVFETGLLMNAVNPEVDVAFGREMSYSLVASIVPVPPRARPKRKATLLIGEAEDW